MNTVPVIVVKNGENILVKVNNQALTLDKKEARILLLKLAEALGYRILTSTPVTRYARDPITGSVKVTIYEGKSVKEIVVPDKLLATYIEVLKELGPGKHAKREILRRVLLKLKDDPMYAEIAERYLKNDGVEWERFFGSRTHYYELFRAPMMILNDAGIVTLRSGTTVTVKPRIRNIGMYDVVKKVSARR